LIQVYAVVLWIAPLMRLIILWSVVHVHHDPPMKQKLAETRAFFFSAIMLNARNVPKSAVAEVMRVSVNNVVISKMECFTQYKPK